MRPKLFVIGDCADIEETVALHGPHLSTTIWINPWIRPINTEKMISMQNVASDRAQEFIETEDEYSHLRGAQLHSAGTPDEYREQYYRLVDELLWEWFVEFYMPREFDRFLVTGNGAVIGEIIVRGLSGIAQQPVPSRY